MVLLPEPETPMTTMMRGSPGNDSCATRSLQHGRDRPPGAGVAREELRRLTRPVAPGRVGREAARARVAPRIEKGLHDTPPRLDAGRALEERGIADHAVVDQRLVAGRGRGLEVV